MWTSHLENESIYFNLIEYYLVLMLWDKEEMFLICFLCISPVVISFITSILSPPPFYGKPWKNFHPRGSFSISLIFPIAIFWNPSKAATYLWDSVAALTDRILDKPGTSLASYIWINNYPILVPQNLVIFITVYSDALLHLLNYYF